MLAGATPLRWAILTSLWLASVAFGLALLVDYDARPGRANDSLVQWPAGTALQMNQRGGTLVMFLHTHCPCSWASLEELDRLLQGEKPRPRLYILMVHAKIDDSADQSAIVHRAALLPDAVVMGDPDAAEARRFGSHTSGTLLVFDADGRCTYAGGLTAARGHVGPNKARDAATAALRGRPQVDAMPVFGCPLF
jgi:hypothetical protein